MFSTPNGNVSISGGNFTQVVHQPEQRYTECRSTFECSFRSLINNAAIKKAFEPYYISGATHDNNDFVDPPKCHPGTRTSFLDRLSDWVKDTETSVHISWLGGPAGAGKSAIARSLAERLESEELLAGSFFFYHRDGRRNSEKFVVTTLAQQLAFSVPAVQVHLAKALTVEPTIYSRALPTQFAKLIIDPLLQTMSASIPPDTPCFRPMIMIVDGLDECHDIKARRLVLQTIRDAVPQFRGHLRFLITSRPEHDIQTFFKAMVASMEGQVKLIELKSDLQAYEDVRKYLVDNFKRIKQEHTLWAAFKPDWPPESSIDCLVDKSSGHFVYASTVIKYIENVRDRPEKRLQDITELRKTSKNPYGELDSLYLNILRTCETDDRERILLILSACLLCSSAEDCSSFPNDFRRAPDAILRHDRIIESVLALEIGDVQLALLDLKSLVGPTDSFTIPPAHPRVGAEISYPDIQRLEFWHKSFPDFLSDPKRAKEFYVPSELSSASVVKGCLRILSGNDGALEK